MALPGADLAAATAAEFATLERLWYDAEWPDGVRVELIDSELVMSPSPSWQHSAAVDALMDQLFDCKRGHGWRFHPNLTVHVPGTRDRLIPDLIVAAADAPTFSNCELLSTGILLVAEVVSASSLRRDRETKNRAYAQGGITLYLLIDRFAEPPAVTLFTRPGPGGYQAAQSATAGQRLRLPDPFGIALDTARLLA